MNYRESISRPADVRYVHKKQSGGSGQFADVAIRFEPSEPGEGFVFKSDIKGGAVPKEYIPGVVKVSCFFDAQQLLLRLRDSGVKSCLLRQSNLHSKWNFGFAESII